MQYRGFWLEMRAMLSSEPSYFSKKRVTEVIAFCSVIISYLAFIIANIRVLTATEFVIASTPILAIAGYVLNHTQKEKKG